MDFLGDDGFVRGLLVSLSIVVPLGVALVVLSRWLWTGVPVGGAAAVAASLLALAGTDVLDGAVVAGTLLAGAGGLVGAVFGMPAIVRCTLVVPGAALAATSVGDAESWMVGAAIAAVAVFGPAADVVDARYRRTGLGVAMLCVSVAGVFVTVPETDSVVAVLGAMTPIGLLAVPRALASLGPGGASAMLALLAALTLDGGWTRSGAVVGGLLAPGLLFLLVLLPVPPPEAVARSWPSLARRLLVLQITLVVGVTRVAGLLDSAPAATAVAAGFGAVAWMVARHMTTAVVEAPTGGP